MKLSELIALLQEQLQSMGDVPVYIETWAEWALCSEHAYMFDGRKAERKQNGREREVQDFPNRLVIMVGD